jgi:hypothetical protein
MQLTTTTYLDQVSAVSWQSPDGAFKVRKITAGHGGTAYEVTPESGRAFLVSSLGEALEAVEKAAQSLQDGAL